MKPKPREINHLSGGAGGPKEQDQHWSPNDGPLRSPASKWLYQQQQLGIVLNIQNILNVFDRGISLSLPPSSNFPSSSEPVQCKRGGHCFSNSWPKGQGRFGTIEGWPTTNCVFPEHPLLLHHSGLHPISLVSRAHSFSKCLGSLTLVNPKLPIHLKS